jgi:hypothetical protein
MDAVRFNHPVTAEELVRLGADITARLNVSVRVRASDGPLL